jgi:hypothetical protein
VEDPKAAAAASPAASAAASVSSSPAPPPASAPSAPQPSVSPPASVPACSPSSFPPKIGIEKTECSDRGISHQGHRTSVRAVLIYEVFTNEGFDGELISLFKGMSFSDVSQKLETIGVAQELHRDLVVNELCKLFDPLTYPWTNAYIGACFFFALRCTAAPCFFFLYCFSHSISRALSWQAADVHPLLPGDGQSIQQSKCCCSLL